MTTYTVISNADSGAGTLRSYIGVAQAGDIINFAPSVQLITLANPLEIKTNITIEGSQPAKIGTPGVIISGNSATREFTVDSGVSTNIDGGTLVRRQHRDGEFSCARNGCYDDKQHGGCRGNLQ